MLIITTKIRRVKMYWYEGKEGDLIKCVQKQIGHNGENNLEIGSIYVLRKRDTSFFPFAAVNGKTGQDCGWYKTECFEKIENEIETQPRGGVKMLGQVKGYIEKHKDTLFTLALIILIDQFLFKGALREKIQSSMGKVLEKVEGTLHKEE
jgi:hypothetical protein